MISEQIQKDLVIALKNKKEVEISTLRLLLSEIHNYQIEKQTELDDEEIVVVLRKEVKKRREAIDAYQKGGRQELADKENQELDVLSKYLPQEIPLEELEKITKEVIEELGASTPSDFGRVMGVVMSKVKGRIDGTKVSEVVKKLI